MLRDWLSGIVFPTLLLTTGSVSVAQTSRALDASFFVEKLYPLMRVVQCNLCHNDNGVASGTQLEFPGAEVSREQIAAFGLELLDLVDRRNPKQSPLLLKPTNREEHTGGVRIQPGSDQEQLLLQWINYLAGLSDEQVRQARETIARSRHVGLHDLTVRRLTHSQYNNTVRDLLGDQSLPANSFPSEDFVHGFTNQLEGQGVSPLLAEAYSKAAERLAKGAFRVGDFRGLMLEASIGSTHQETAESFVRQFGLQAFRRPLAEDEVKGYARLFVQEAARVGDRRSGARIVVETMLQSPHFLFRVERGRGGPYEQYEIASRLSYFLWDTMPSDELFAAAENGELATLTQVETITRRMLRDPRSQNSLEEFLAQWMRFDRVLSATRDRRRYGRFNTELATAMVEETRQLFNHLVWQDRNFMEFFTADYTFISADLAQLYALPVPSQEYGLVRYPADSGRSGVLGHGSFLVATSKPSETSPTERGLFVRNHFLGHEVPAPPPGVNTALPEVTKDTPQTNRQRLQVHLNSQACSDCHRLIDPIGLGFEQYDAIGGFRKSLSLQFSPERYAEKNNKTTTVELDLNTSAYIQGIQDSTFSTPRQLGRILAANEACQKCIVKKLFRFTFGRHETDSDQRVIDAVFQRFRDSGFQFRELIVSLVTSDLFLQRGS